MVSFIEILILCGETSPADGSGEGIVSVTAPLVGTVGVGVLAFVGRGNTVAGEPQPVINNNGTSINGFDFRVNIFFSFTI